MDITHAALLAYQFDQFSCETCTINAVHFNVPYKNAITHCTCYINILQFVISMN